MKRFFLKSIDDSVFEKPRECTAIRWVRSESRSDLLLVEISPSLFGRPFGIPKPGISSVLLASRNAIGGLRKLRCFPQSVHVALMEDPPDRRGRVCNASITSISWAEIFDKKEDALALTNPILETYPERLFGIRLRMLLDWVSVSWTFLDYGFKKGWIHFSALHEFSNSPHNGLSGDVAAKASLDFYKAVWKVPFEEFSALADRYAREESERMDVPSEADLHSMWTYAIYQWTYQLKRPERIRLALADEIAEEFGWPATLAGFSRKDGFPPEDEARRMAAWQTWLDEEREKWKPERPETEVSK